jgi:hypothetical protein
MEQMLKLGYKEIINASFSSPSSPFVCFVTIICNNYLLFYKVTKDTKDSNDRTVVATNKQKTSAAILQRFFVYELDVVT